jgi:serine/threonine protein kinase/formylglycine-generating enzyme required for sulfatase activity
MSETPDRTESLFAATVALASPVERTALLDRECGDDLALRARIEALLRAHDRAGHLLDRPLLSQSHRTGVYDLLAAADPSEAVGALLAGRYKLLEEIGAGGMGTVWLAEQTEPVRRKVALKLIKPGMDSRRVLARFEAERQALALMDHPNIAKILDGGLTEKGRPFFVMDYVKGVPITEYCDAARLSVANRLQLFMQVCHAVQHAHQKGILHRDLKPSNILVAPCDDKPVPKVIDFGLAKAMHQSLTERTLHTAHETMVGTPLYMSPEQARLNNLDVDTRTDVYSLGVLLYELLTGTTPLAKERFKEAAWDEVCRHIREEEPPRPSMRLSSSDTLPSLAANRQTEPARLTRLVRGELDCIVMKALEKDRNRRYETAAHFARDLQRYLADEPVEAKPPSVRYRMGKFLRRNKGPALAAALVLLALAVGTTVSYLKYLDAEQRKQEAQTEAEKAMKARDFLVSIFELSDANGQRGTMTARQILDDAEQRIPKEFADQPELRAELLAAVETVYAKITANAPLAMILEVGGAVRLQSTRNPNQRAVPQALLYAGDRLVLAADAQVQLVILSDLHKERLRPGTEATIRRKGCEPADAVRERNQDILMSFVRLPKGTFYMGCDGAKKGTKTEIKEDFEIAVHTVTQGQWQALMGDNPSHFSRFGAGRNEVKSISDEELKLFPVETVSWNDAQAFIKKLNEKERGSGFLYRLPSEAEWEYACRAGATSEEECSYLFYFDKPTNDLSSEKANFNGNYPVGKAPKGDFLRRTTRVGAYPPNKLGLCDMHGNLWQWCADQVEGRSLWVMCGGSWLGSGTTCQAAFRVRAAATGREYFHGFRLVRVSVR